MGNTEKLDLYGMRSSSDVEPKLTEITVIEDNGVGYRILPGMLGAGGESQIYNAEGVADGKKYLARLSDQFNMTKQEKEFHNDLRSRLKQPDAASHGLMPLIASGTYRDSGVIEIMPRAERIQSCDYNMLRSTVIPGLLEAIGYLHSLNIVHRDIKPENIYMLNGKIVLGDFGTASVPTSPSRLSGITRSRRGTPGYTAPEVNEGYFRKESDYFSLGCTIATLYKGEHVFSNVLGDKKDEGSFSVLFNENGLVLDCKKNEKDLQILVDALTLYITKNGPKRAGYSDVKLWLDDKNGFVRKWEGVTARSAPAGGGAAAQFHEETELTEVFLSDWEKAKQTVFEEYDFFSFLGRKSSAGRSYEFLKKNKLNKSNRDLLLAQFLHYFNRLGDPPVDPPVYWKGLKYGSLEEIAEDVKADRHTEEITSLLQSGFLSWKLDETGFKDSDLTAVIRSLENNMKDNPELAVHVFSVVAEKGYTTDDRGIDNAISAILADRNALWDMCDQRFGSDGGSGAMSRAFKGVYEPLIRCGLIDAVFAIDNSIKDLKDPVDRVGALYRFFEKCANNKAAVRKSYLNDGPYSPTFYTCLHIDRYLIDGITGGHSVESLKNSVADAEKEISNLADKINNADTEKKAENPLWPSAFQFYYPTQSITPVDKKQLQEQKAAAEKKLLRLKNQQEALRLKNEIRKHTPDYNNPPVISDMEKTLFSASKLCNDFLKMLNGNLYYVAKGQLGDHVVYTKDYVGLIASSVYKKRLLAKDQTLSVGFKRENGIHFWDTPIEHYIDCLLNESDKLDRCAEHWPGEPSKEKYSAFTYFFSVFSGYIFYIKDTNSVSDMYRSAINTIERIGNSSTPLGKAIAQEDPCYELLQIYNAVNKGILQGVRHAGQAFYDSFASCQEWKELGAELQKGADVEYETELYGNNPDYVKLAVRKPDDYRPVWFSFKTTLTEKKDQVCSCRLQMNIFESKARDADTAIKENKADSIWSYSKAAVDAAIEAKKSYVASLSDFDAFIRSNQTRFDNIRKKSGSAASELDKYWSDYQSDTKAFLSYDFTADIYHWKRIYWGETLNHNTASNTRSFNNTLSKYKNEVSDLVSNPSTWKISSVKRLAEDTKNERDSILFLFESESAPLHDILDDLKSYYPAAASDLDALWDDYQSKNRSALAFDFDAEIANWQKEYWESLGLCSKCGGTLSYIGKRCKRCGAKNR